MSTRAIRNLFIAGTALGFANFVAFGIGAGILGGVADAAKQDGGRYYVSSHGKYTEVSKSAFTYSRLHERSVFITHPIAMLCMVLAYGWNEKLKRALNEPSLKA